MYKDMERNDFVGLLTVKKVTQETPYTMSIVLEIFLPHNPTSTRVKTTYSTSDLDWNRFPYELQEKQKNQIIAFFDDAIGYGPFADSLLQTLQQKIDNDTLETYINF